VEILRSAANPWGQDVLVGVAWSLLWAALFGGIVFVVLHALYVAIMARRWVRRPAMFRIVSCDTRRPRGRSTG